MSTTKSTKNSFNFFKIPFKKLLLSCLTVITIIGLPYLYLDHSVKNLYTPAPVLQKEEAFFNKLNGNSFSHLLLIYGKDLQSVLEKEEKIKEKEDFFSLSTLLPSIKRQKENAKTIQNLYKQEAEKLQNELGLKKRPLFKQTAFIDKKDFQNHFDFLFQQFIVETSNGILSITPISRPLEISNDDAFILEPAKYLSKQLDLHAKKSYQNLFISFCLLSFTLCIVYRKKAFNYLFPSLLACVGTLSILSLLGQAITFFHLLSLFIVIGLSMDYTIFLFNKNSEYKPVLFSFFSSFIGFGLLSFVHFHMVAIIGQTIALGLLLSFFITLLIKKE